VNGGGGDDEGLRIERRQEEGKNTDPHTHTKKEAKPHEWGGVKGGRGGARRGRRTRMVALKFWSTKS